MRVGIGVAILVVAVGLLAAIAVMPAALDTLSLRITAVVLAAAAILSGIALANLARRWMLRVEQLRGWVNLIAGESDNVRRDIAPDADAVDRVQLAIIDMLGMRMDQQGAIYRRLEEVLNAIPDGVVVVTPEGLISLVNAAGRPLFGKEGSVIGKSIFETLSRHSLGDALVRTRDDDKPVNATLYTVWEDTLHATVARIGSDGSALLRFPAAEAASVALEHDLTLHDRPAPPVPVTPATPLADLPALAIDTETTGLDPLRDRVISIGAVRLHGCRLFRSATVNLLVNPGRSIPNRTIAVHGISNAMVADAPPFEKIVDRLLEHTGGLVLIGHHIDFDLDILRYEMQRCGRDWQPLAGLDIMLLYAGLFPDRRSLLLEDMAADLEVPVVGRHSALGDALTTGEVFVRLLPALSAQGVETLADAQAWQQRPARRLGVGTSISRSVSTP
jgi:DNA polymerase III subunit epsilon